MYLQTEKIVEQVKSLMPFVKKVCDTFGYDNFDYGYYPTNAYWEMEFFKDGKKMGGFSSPDFETFKQMLLDEI